MCSYKESGKSVMEITDEYELLNTTTTNSNQASLYVFLGSGYFLVFVGSVGFSWFCGFCGFMSSVDCMLSIC